jgi:hypothetical protein
MITLLAELSASDWAAWWGAIAGTVVLVWDIIKHTRSGPRVKVRGLAGMQAGPGVIPKGPYILITVVNIGAAPVTLTHIGLVHYKSRLGKVFNRPSEKILLMPREPFQGPLPSMLNIGSTYSSMIEHNKEINAWLKRGYLFAFCSNESTLGETRARIPRPPTPKEKPVASASGE